MKTRLKELRKLKGFTQIRLQIESGIDQALLSKYENEERTPTLENLLILADIYHVSVDYILYRTDRPDNS